MIKFPNGGRIVEHTSELPDLAHARELFLDFETTAFSPAVKAFNAYKGHRACGIAVTVNDEPGAWYVPIRHHDKSNTLHPANLDLDTVLRWSRDLITTCRDWVNHGVKFDAHFAAEDGAIFQGRLVDTLTIAKVLDSDRLYKGGYGLSALSLAWLEEDISPYENRLKSFLEGVKLPRNKKAHDYALAPPDILGEYACQDVITGRKLHRYIQKRMPAECASVVDTEIKLTPVLFDIEREGMHVDLKELKCLELQILYELQIIGQKLHETIGYAINPASPDDCYELLVNHWGLPILARDDKTGNPTFDKDALVSYLAHPEISGNEDRRETVSRMLHYRKRHTLMSFFVRPYIEHEVDGILHPDYNQSVRSGRLSCKRPNAQQLSPEAKLLVHPPPGCAFLSCDYSQIEFRLIVHYIRAVDAIQAYGDDPDTDFHAWVAKLCGIPRKPAKNVNFAIGYGAGKRKVMKMLASEMELMAELMTKVDGYIKTGRAHESQRKDLFDVLCQRRAEEVYNRYHDRLPGIKTTSRKAEQAARRRGYVFNAYGRRAHLPNTHCHLAFNRIIQGCAADVMKERTVAVAPRYNPEIRELGIRIAGSVHDETLFVGDAETTRDPRIVNLIVQILEDTAQDFRVSIRTSAGWSSSTWAEASSDDARLEITHAA